MRSLCSRKGNLASWHHNAVCSGMGHSKGGLYQVSKATVFHTLVPRLKNCSTYINHLSVSRHVDTGIQSTKDFKALCILPLPFPTEHKAQ